MPLDPKAKALLDQIAAAGLPPAHTLSAPQVREIFDGMLASSQGAPEPVARVEDRRIAGAAGEIPIRVYTPAGRAPFPVLVYFHGGGWVIGSLDTHDATCRALANSAACVVVSVGYRLAPEHKFPAAPEDCYGAVCWVAQNAGALNADARRIAVGGDSAGGNLAAAVALMARDRSGPKIAFQLLVYPVTDRRFDTPSYRENGDGYFLTRDLMVWFWDHYLRSDADAAEPYASPARAKDLRGLPPALVVTAEFDPLRDEGEAYAARLKEAGVPVTLERYPGIIHGFFTMAGALDQAKPATAKAAAALREAFR